MEQEALVRQVEEFMLTRVIPTEQEHHHQLQSAANRWTYTPIMRQLRAEAKAKGLWLFPLPVELGGRGLSLVEYAPICEIMNWCNHGPEIFNCYTGTISNSNSMHLHASSELKQRYLKPLVEGDVRSCISITERNVPSSDPTDLKFDIRRDGDDYVLNGVKSWATGGCMDECAFYLVLGATDISAPRHARHSMVLVPREAKGLSLGRIETVMGYDDAPFGHCDLIFENVRVPVANRIGDEGAGFLMMQSTLGVGRIQLGMGAIGAAERAMMEMCSWVEKRIIGGRPLVERQVVTDAIARSRIEIDACRAFALQTARRMQEDGMKAVRGDIAQLKVLAPEMALKVLDRAMQFHGGAGLSYDTPLPEMWAHMRTVRIGEGADEVHRETVAKVELKRQAEWRVANRQT
ncbi:acyl-CoA dehydrogenase family protein [Sandaracinobacter sp. RS1-74]|uniref:acyl-CoA dehydrogenase family protein n=1 Tax=Sandaracinobacteroides sayramensis TaxID=2913411 RepID=UPI001EDADAA8|nr:acyl-CoA dehydrogenase family protein [Sandaracinobacteroides sayramensis]MCG2840930.1 acyl-CoA dehydrogenase family protein [Sandaracinobacteroides sayramensis]